MRHYLIPLLLLVSVGLTGAQERFRADDGNFWHLADNPSLPALADDVVSMGALTEIRPESWDQAEQKIRVVSPWVSLGYQWSPLRTRLDFTTSVRWAPGFAFGMSNVTLNEQGSKDTSYAFGVASRPWDGFSMGVTLDSAFDARRVWGAGLAVRPLAFLDRHAQWLTLTSDGTWSANQWSWQETGLRFSWEGSDLRVWYNLTSRQTGVEATLSWGPAEASGTATSAGAALRWGQATQQTLPGARLILKLGGRGTLSSAPQPKGLWFNTNRTPSLTELVEQIHRATEDRRVVAIVWENPPSVEGLASGEELASALKAFQGAGKRVYIQAESYQDSLGFQAWIAAADRVALDPTGVLALTASGSRRLYLKGLFDKIGVQFVSFAPWETKSAFNPFTYNQMPEGEKAMLTRFLTNRDQTASALLEQGRGKRLKESGASLVARGPYLVPFEALNAGLVDALENRADFETTVRGLFPGAQWVDELLPSRDDSWAEPLVGRTVALVHLSGSIIPGEGEAGRSIGNRAVETLARLRDDPRIRAVVIRVDSPGGAVPPSDALADQVKKTVASGKPVLVLMGDVAASGGYYLSAPATRIWARKGTITGSIGVTAVVFHAEKALESVGVHPDGVDLAPSAAFGDWTRPISEPDQQKWNAMIQATYQRFLDVVATGRNIDKAKLEPLARGQVYTGAEALDLGLVDALGGQEEARAWLETKLGGPIEWESYVPGETAPLGGLLSPMVSVFARWSNSPSLKLADTLDQWAGSTTQALVDVAERGPGPQVWADLP